MGWRDRITDGISGVGDRIKEEVAEFVAGPDGASSVEGFILGLVRSARSDDEQDASPASAKQLGKDARKRRRRLGLASFAAGPFAGVAGEATDLYSETATVCDIVELHRLSLTDAEVGGHMLALWGFVVDPAMGAKARAGTGPAIVELLRTEAATRYQAADSVPKKVKVIWEHRDAFGDVREAATSGAFSRVVRAGRDSKDLIARAQEQLGVRPL